ncbi:MAG: hypothetical protein HY330_03160 [Chloroflexi bacterium]|nr:hypothetical protein [Chloroflexota bacterium]
MVAVPAFLLRRLYVKGSLRNTADGFELQLKNSLGSGYAKGIMPLAVDGQEVPLAATFFRVDGVATPFTAVTEQSPFTLALNKATTIAINGQPLTPGAHKLVIGFVVVGLGKLSFDVTDAVA